MRILFTICGRAGSKGIKSKNVRMFCGNYLVYYAISAIDLYLQKHPETDADIVASSDSEQLLHLVDQNGMLSDIHKIVRSQNLANDTVGKIEAIADCYIKMKERLSASYDMVVDLDITSPLRTIEDLEQVIDVHRTRSADVTTTVAHARRNPFFNQLIQTDHGVKKVIDSNYTARQQAPTVYDMNAAIYAYHPDFLLSGKGVLDGYCEVVETYDTGILDLDYESDFELMEVIARHLFETNENYRVVRDNIR